MKEKHITEILDRAPFSALSGEELGSVSAHAEACADCRRAFDAARLSAALLEAEGEVVPPPFFQAKVMNAWRARQQEAAAAARRPILAFRRWWQASAAPVFMMLTTLAVLISLTLLAPQSKADDSSMEISEFNLYSPDAVILNQRQPRELTTEQVFEVIYSSSRNTPRKQQ